MSSVKPTKEDLAENVCGHGCYPDSGGSYVCGRKPGHDGDHASLYGHGAVWNERHVREGFLRALLADTEAPKDKCRGAECYGCPVACPEKGFNIDNDVNKRQCWATTDGECARTNECGKVCRGV